MEGFHIVVDAGNGAGGFFAVTSLCNFISTSIRLVWGIKFIHSELYAFTQDHEVLSFEFGKSISA